MMSDEDDDDLPDLDDSEVAALEEALAEIEEEDRQAVLAEAAPPSDDIAKTASSKETYRKVAGNFVGQPTERRTSATDVYGKGDIRTNDSGLKSLLETGLARTTASLEQRRSEPRKRRRK